MTNILYHKGATALEQLISNLNPVQAEGMKNSCLDSMPLAMVYAPMQKWDQIYEQQVALVRGTIFPALDLPFIGEEAVPDGCK